MAEEYIKRILAKAEFTGNFRDEYPTALIHALIDSVPAADVQPVRHGKWEKRMNIDLMIWCSECGWMKHQGDKRNYNYCPNCGAKMDKED